MNALRIVAAAGGRFSQELGIDLAAGQSGDVFRWFLASVLFRRPRNLEERLKALARGIGSVTVNIFLREMRGIWRKAQPLPSDLVMLAAGNIGSLPCRTGEQEQALVILQEQWKESKGRAKDFPDLESALLRIGKDYCRKKACDACPVLTLCRPASLAA